MARSFTEQEKINIREKLVVECEKSWAKFGYKKTNLDDLCAKAGISKGAFYLFFESKEALFCDTLCVVQDRLYCLAEEIMHKNQNRVGMAQALKAIYREYNKNSFICNANSTDFISFTNKLSPEQLNKIAQNSIEGGVILLNKPYLKLLIERDKAVSVISAMLLAISLKDELPCNHIEVFDFMIDNLIEKIFE